MNDKKSSKNAKTKEEEDDKKKKTKGDEKKKFKNETNVKYEFKRPDDEIRQIIPFCNNIFYIQKNES